MTHIAKTLFTFLLVYFLFSLYSHALGFKATRLPQPSRLELLTEAAK
jgi:hypothetical protein